MRKYFKNCETQEDVKRVYRQLCMKLHPDNNPDHDTTREFQDMQEEFRQVFEEVKNFHRAASGNTYTQETNETADDFMEVIEKLQKMHGVTIELVGTWLWCSGNTYPVRDQLKAMRFRFSGKNKKWYLPEEAKNDSSDPDDKKKVRASKLSFDEIRSKYGSRFFAGEPDLLLK